ncbi:DUF11 domain-containing protein [Yinghuangia soli]|uniref:DUF11 domain-containing protein n=1 Tax=Yinghuangia soli TaxID=2908204 RepID=A0AA41Q2S1_9ACTN|nr:DUF11 domain-containing protein [Yinghuangia soli]MCF2530478.1 DUF11 domain-containing protein [Yinghuangia soli]
MRIRRTAATLSAAGLLAAAAPVAAADSLPAPTRPALSIKVDDGATKTRAKQEHTYVVRLKNLGSTDLDRMAVTETLPSGMTLVSAGEGGTRNDGSSEVMWTVDLPAGQEVTRTLKARVDKLPSGQAMASTACARLAGSSVPIVCSTDLDQLPTKAELAAAAEMPRTTLYGGIAAAVLAVGGGTWWVLRRRRARVSAPEQPA